MGLGLNIVANFDQDIAPAYDEYYSALAEHFVREIGPARGIRLVLEVGAGKGQLTVPLLKRFQRSVTLIAADSSRGPYTGWLEELLLVIAKNRLESRVRVLKADARRLVGVKNRSVDVVVSNELLCDLTSEGHLWSAFKEFYRVLKPGGIMVHGEWSSIAEDESQSFMVKHWPSWSPDKLYSYARKAGFEDFRVSYFDTTITFGYEAAVKEFQSWGARESLLRKSGRLVRRHGIRLPHEHVIRCRKASDA